MELRKITEDFLVSPQIAPGDLPAIARAGIRSVICNRPDGEAADQPAFPEISAAAEAAGLRALYLPMRGGSDGLAESEAMARMLAEAPRPVLAYCRSGTRSATLWTMAEAGQRPAEEIVSATQAAGYDTAAALDRVARHRL